MPVPPIRFKFRWRNTGPTTAPSERSFSRTGTNMKSVFPFRAVCNASVAAMICFRALTPFCIQAAAPAFSTLAGYPGHGNATGTGAAARFNNPWGIAVDASHNLYVADTDNHVVRKITSGGAVSTLAGSPGVSGSADGLGGGAVFNQPQGIAVDASGNVYVAD